MAKTLTINGHLVRSVTLAGANVKAIGDGVNTLWEQAQPDYFYIENLADSVNTVTLPKTGSETEWVSLEYSLDKTNWANYDLETGVSVPVGGKLYLRGYNNVLTYNATNYHTFVSTGNIGAGGKAISLLSADLSATTVGNRAFQFLFMGNTNLINTATTLFDGIVTTGTYAFNQVFRDCTNLQNVCAFANVTTATGFSFVQTYYNCTSITNASGFLPNVTSTTGNQVFASTFRGCTSLTTLPSFANVSIGADVSVFNGTFYGCTAVTIPSAMPQNPVNVAGSHKFYQMYYNCTNLQRSPKMSIATATENMLCGIFYNCSNIDYINIEFSAWDGATDFTKNWVTNVHSTGVFCKNTTLPVTRGASNIPTNWSIADLNGKLYAPVITENGGTITIAEAEGGASCQIYYTTDGTTPTTNSTLYTQPFAVAGGTTVKAIAHYNGQSSALVTDSDVASCTAEIDYFYIENLADSANTVTLPKTGSETEWVELEYSLDKTNWDDYDLETGVSVPVGGKLYLRGDNNTMALGGDDYHTFTSTGNIKAGGKAISLLSKDLSQNTIQIGYAFSRLFENNTYLLNTETELFDGFSLGTSGTNAFQNTFAACSNLQDVCSFSGITTVTESTFNTTYRDCSSIVDLRGFLPNYTGTYGIKGFYNTFRGCKNLRYTPTLTISATAESLCKYMFCGCTRLENASSITLSTTTLGNSQYSNMFYNCSSLKVLPTLPTTTITLGTSSMENMFANTNSTNTAYVTVPNLTFGQPASGAAKGACQMFLRSGIRDARNITINCITDPGNNFARFAQECTQLYYSPHFNFNVLTTSDALRNAVNQSNQLHLIYGNVPQMGAVTNQWTYKVCSKGVFCTNSTLTIIRNASGASEANCDYIPTLWSIADLNGKLYAPVITENAGEITINEYSGGASCEIYYTTDGTTPTPSTGTLYTQPFVIASGDVVKAIAHFALDTDAGVMDSDVAVLVNQPTLSYSGCGVGTGSPSVCSGNSFHHWTARIKTTGVEGVTYYINYKNSATESIPPIPTTSVYDLTATYTDTTLSEADSEVLAQFRVCDADLVGDYLNIAVIGVLDGNVSEVAYLSMDFNRQ